MTFEEMHAVVQTAHNHRLKVTGHCRATEGIKNALRAGYDTLERGTFMDSEALEMLLERNTPVIPALQFEMASIERGPEVGMPQAVIDGHQGTLEPGKLADLLVVNGDVVADISVLEDRSRFIAVMQGGEVRAGRVALM